MTGRLVRSLVRLVIALLLGVVSVVSLTSAAVAAPERLIIPKVGVNAPIVPVPVVGGKLMIGNSVDAVYRPRRDDPLCDPLGTSIIAGHTYRAGDGVADNWRNLRAGDTFRAGGCRFKVQYTVVRSGKFRIGHLMRADGPPRVVLIGCKPDDYSRRVMVFARKVGR
jgi:hypothetical protein